MIVGPNAVVLEDVPSGSVVVGIPARGSVRDQMRIWSNGPQSSVNRLLVVGSRDRGPSETIGGANVLMGKLLDHLNARPDIDFLFAKANRYPSAVRSLLSSFSRLGPAVPSGILFL